METVPMQEKTTLEGYLSEVPWVKAPGIWDWSSVQADGGRVQQNGLKGKSWNIQ